MTERLSAVTNPFRTLFEVGAVGGMTDGQLLHLFTTRSDEAAAEAAFKALMERHGPLVLKVCRDVLGDEHAAEDAFQATFLVLARRASSIRKADSVASWLFGIARRIATKSRADAARRRARDRIGAEMAARRTDGPDRAESWPELYEELDRLPEKYREPLVLCYLTGLTYEQAAGRLQCPVRTVQTRLIRGRERLRGKLIRRGLAPMAAWLAAGVAADAARAAVPAALMEVTARSALSFAAGRAAGVASPSALSLAEGALKTMLLNKLRMAAVALTLGIAATIAVKEMVGAQVPPKPGPGTTAKAAPRSDRAALQGRWSVTMKDVDGQMRTMICNIEGDRIAIQVIAPDGTAEEVLKGRFVTDPSARPRTFAVVETTGLDGHPQQDNLGIYELDGDLLKLCYGTPGRPRPTEFKQGQDGPPMLLVLKRGGPQARPATPRGAAPGPGEQVEVSGRVLGPDGRPIAAAKIVFFRPDDAHAGEEPRPVIAGEREVRAVSGPDGRFQFRVAAADFTGIESGYPSSQPTISAVAEGYGPGWVACRSPAWASGVTLKLAKDDIPVSGRVLDLEGRPVAGATVRVLSLLGTLNDDPGPILKALRASQSPFAVFVRSLDGSVSGLPESVRTGSDGRFRLTGTGRGRVVNLRIDGPAIATQKNVAVLANPTPLADARDAVKTIEAGATFSANPTFDVIAGPTQPVVGVVRDKDTGQPLPGVVVKSWKLAQAPYIANDFVRTTTDAQGRYRLVGLPKGPGHSIIAVPADDQPYLASVIAVGSAPGVEPVTADIALKRGILIQGRVTSGPEGRPVRARVEYFVERSNPHMNDAPGFAGVFNAVPTRPDGSYAVAALPGGGLLAVRAGDQFLTADKQGDLKYSDATKDWWPSTPYLLLAENVHAIVRVAIRDDEREVRRDIELHGTGAAALSGNLGRKP
jgi:RNA polymerase sigma factor (sigma-70 family)